MRDITDVIDRMLAHVRPNDAAMTTSMERVRHDAAFTAPEVMRVRWAQLSAVFDSRYGELAGHADWYDAAGRILAGLE